MTTNERIKVIKKYKRLSNKRLAKEFIEHDKIALKLWSDIDDDTADEHTILQELIVERFVKNCNVGLVWSDSKQNWVPYQAKNNILEYPINACLVD